MSDYTMQNSLSQISGRIPPQNLEAEQAVLGSILLKPEVIDVVIEIVETDDFYKKAHQTIYGAMLELYNTSDPYDLLTVSSHLSDKNQLDQAGGPAYLASLTSIVPVTANIKSYANIIREKSILRRIISANNEIINKCYEQHDAAALLDRAEQSIFSIARDRNENQLSHIKNVLPDVFDSINERFKKKELITGVPTGYRQIDTLTAGLQPADLIVVAARPSMGKTSFAMNIAQHAALIEKTGVVVFSLEMSKEQLLMRLVCAVARVDSQRVRSGRLIGEDWDKLSRAVSMLLEASIFIDDTPAITVQTMRAKIRRLASQHDVGLIVVDYLQLMQGEKSENRNLEISDISRSLKALAKEFNVPVIALSQLNRSVDQRKDRRPIMSDLRESGAIEQDADVICFIYRDEVYNAEPTNPDIGTAEIIIAKQRNGPTGLVKLTFIKKYTLFENMAPIEEPEELASQQPNENNEENI